MPKTKLKKADLKQPAIHRQKRRHRQDTAYITLDGRRIHLGIYGSPEAEQEYRRVIAEWNLGLITPKQTDTATTTVAELVLRFHKERNGKVALAHWDFEYRATAVLVALYGDMDAATFEGGIEVVQFLVSNGANVNARANNGFTPLAWARRENHTAVVQYLSGLR